MDYARILKLLGGCLMPVFCVLAVSYHLELNARKASHPQLVVRVAEGSALTDLQSLEKLDIDLYAEDLRQIRRQVRQLSWVRDASVRRVWPDKLYLDVKSRQPLAYWGKAYVLSTDGTLVDKTALSVQLPLPRVNGPKAYREQIAQKLIQVSEALQRSGMHLQSMQMEEWGELSVVNASGQEIMFGSSHLESRLERLQQLMATGDSALHRATRLDLRYLSAVAVRSGK